MTTESFQVGNATFGDGRLTIIAGPCVIESQEHALMMARECAQRAHAAGLDFVFKSSFDKANRTSITSFRGPGLERGLEVLAKVKKQIGVPVLTDVHTETQATQAGHVVDVLQIPAFLCRQTDLLVAAASVMVGTRAFAHHSFAATYLEDQTVTIEGELVQFLFRNPHSFVHVMVKEKDGAINSQDYEAAAKAAGELGKLAVIADQHPDRTDVGLDHVDRAAALDLPPIGFVGRRVDLFLLVNRTIAKAHVRHVVDVAIVHARWMAAGDDVDVEAQQRAARSRRDPARGIR